VNTVPPKTLDALLDHGKVSAGTVERGVTEARAAFTALAQAGIVLDHITEALSVAGVASFASAYENMLDAIAAKQKRLAHAGP
jgi:transaldolase